MGEDDGELLLSAFDPLFIERIGRALDVVDVKYRQSRGNSLSIEPPPVLEMSMEAEGGETALEF